MKLFTLTFIAGALTLGTVATTQAQPLNRRANLASLGQHRAASVARGYALTGQQTPVVIRRAASTYRVNHVRVGGRNAR